MFLKKKLIKIPDMSDYLLFVSAPFLPDKKTFIETSKAYETLILLNNVVIGKIPYGYNKSIYEWYGKGEKNVTLKIVYLNKLDSDIMHWGFGNLHIDNNKIKETYDIGANGTFAFKIIDYTKFLKNFNLGKNVSFYDIESTIKQEIISVTATILSNIFNGKDPATIFDANSYLLDFISQTKECLERSDVLKNYGLKVTTFNSNPIHIKDEHLKLIQDRINGLSKNENSLLSLDIQSKIKNVIESELNLSQYNDFFNEINSKIDSLNNKIDNGDLVCELNNTKKAILDELKDSNKAILTNENFVSVRDSLVDKVEEIFKEKTQNKSELNFADMKTSLERVISNSLDTLDYDKRITELNNKIDSLINSDKNPNHKIKIEDFKNSIIGELRNTNNNLSQQNLARIENSVYERINKIIDNKIEVNFNKMFEKIDESFELKLKESINEFKKYMDDFAEDDRVNDYEKDAYDVNKSVTFEELIDRSKTEFDYGLAATRIFMEVNDFVIKNGNEIHYKNGNFYTTKKNVLDCVNAFKNTDYPIKIELNKTLSDFPLPSRCRFYLCGATVDEAIAGFIFWKALNCFRHPTDKGNLYIKRQLEVFEKDKKEYLKVVHSYFKKIGFITC